MGVRKRKTVRRTNESKIVLDIHLTCSLCGRKAIVERAKEYHWFIIRFRNSEDDDVLRLCSECCWNSFMERFGDEEFDFGRM